jgi:hypothetical protein
MKTITLRPLEATKRILARLEKKGLIRTFKPTRKILRLGARKKGGVDTVYSSSTRYGSHKLICIRQDDFSEVALTYHDDNEEFLLINNTPLKFKPLYIVIGLRKRRELERKAGSGRLSGKDIMVLKFGYNDPATSIFTMLKDTPHCQITKAGKGRPPIFFVTEPSRLTGGPVKLPGYKFIAR